jgi:hypothetical protein
MTTNRNIIIGAIVVAVVVVGAYFMLTANDATPPQPAPAKTQPKS